MLAICEQSEVISHEIITDEIRLLRVKWQDEKGGHTPLAGQFFTLRAWAQNETPFLSRPISVHHFDAKTKELEFLYQIKGAGTQKIAALKVGDTLQVAGPMGNGFDVNAIAQKYKKIAVIGGGIGTAPLYQLCHELIKAGTKPEVFFGFADMPYRLDAFENLGLNVNIATDSGKVGQKGLVTSLYNPKDFDVLLVCGAHLMMHSVAKSAAENGVDCLVSLESKMACGIGACLGCTCKTTKEEARSICKDGPIFNAK